MIRIPGIPGNPVSRSFRSASHGELVHICFSDYYHSRLFQTADRLRLIGRHKIFQHSGSAGGLFSFYADIILYRYRHPGQRSCVNSLRNAFFYLSGSRIGLFFINIKISVYPVFLFFNFRKHSFYTVQHADLTLLYLLCQFKGSHFFQIHFTVSLHFLIHSTHIYPIVFGT